MSFLFAIFYFSYFYYSYYGYVYYSFYPTFTQMGAYGFAISFFYPVEPISLGANILPLFGLLLRLG